LRTPPAAGEVWVPRPHGHHSYKAKCAVEITQVIETEKWDGSPLKEVEFRKLKDGIPLRKMKLDKLGFKEFQKSFTRWGED
jgi:hypothetical protein